MDKKLIREALIHHPHIKKVWVCPNGYTTVKRANAIETSIEDLFESVKECELTPEPIAEEKELQEIPVKPKKKK